MNKSEFIEAIANEAGTTKKSANAFYDAFVKVVSNAMLKNDKIALVGFGTFEAKKKPARTCTNPMTGAKVKVAACKAPVLKFGKNFKDSL